VRRRIFRAIYRDPFLAKYGTAADEMAATRPRFSPWGNRFHDFPIFRGSRWMQAPFFGEEPVGDYGIHILVTRPLAGHSAAPHVLGMTRNLASLACAVLLVLPHAAIAQGYPFSQRGSVTQTIAFTNISVTYGRPVARGRALFGQLVPWDSIWHPGADSATLMRVDHDVLFEGHQVKAGEYSLWLIPRAKAPWTVILSRAAHTFHKPYPGASFDVLRFDVTPEPVSHMESLAIYFPVVLRDEATMRIHWGETAVPIRIKAPYRPE
jgi:hypothetical protein